MGMNVCFVGYNLTPQSLLDKLIFTQFTYFAIAIYCYLLHCVHNFTGGSGHMIESLLKLETLACLQL